MGPGKGGSEAPCGTWTHPCGIQTLLWPGLIRWSGRDCSCSWALLSPGFVFPHVPVQAGADLGLWTLGSLRSQAHRDDCTHPFCCPGPAPKVGWEYKLPRWGGNINPVVCGPWPGALSCSPLVSWQDSSVVSFLCSFKPEGFSPVPKDKGICSWPLGPVPPPSHSQSWGWGFPRLLCLCLSWPFCLWSFRSCSVSPQLFFRRNRSIHKCEWWVPSSPS